MGNFILDVIREQYSDDDLKDNNGNIFSLNKLKFNLNNKIIRGDKMRIIVSLCIGILILAGCGKKSEPKYQGKIQQSKIIL